MNASSFLSSLSVNKCDSTIQPDISRDGQYRTAVAVGTTHTAVATDTQCADLPLLSLYMLGVRVHACTAVQCTADHWNQSLNPSRMGTVSYGICNVHSAGKNVRTGISGTVEEVNRSSSSAREQTKTHLPKSFSTMPTQIAHVIPSTLITATCAFAALTPPPCSPPHPPSNSPPPSYQALLLPVLPGVRTAAAASSPLSRHKASCTLNMFLDSSSTDSRDALAVAFAVAVDGDNSAPVPLAISSLLLVLVRCGFCRWD